MIKKELEQISLAKSIFQGIVKDSHGYCGCPKCGSRELTHDGDALDSGYISCCNCYYNISGSDPYEMIVRWNSIHRDSFQLELSLNYC